MNSRFVRAPPPPGRSRLPMARPRWILHIGRHQLEELSSWATGRRPCTPTPTSASDLLHPAARGPCSARPRPLASRWT